VICISIDNVNLINIVGKYDIEKAKVIETSSISVGEWVKWKCQYGCPLYNKDKSHPSMAPSTEDMKKVLKEYTYAILVNGVDGPRLSKSAINIEHDLYKAGYYKAFALIALPFNESET